MLIIHMYTAIHPLMRQQNSSIVNLETIDSLPTKEMLIQTKYHLSYHLNE